MSYFRTCPNCGANNDPCEPCDCQKEDKPTVIVKIINKKGEDIKREKASRVVGHAARVV